MLNQDIVQPIPTTPRERVTKKLSSAGEIGEDIKASKIRISINNIEQTDGKFTATFNVNGLPQAKNDFDSSYRNIPKIFDTWEDLSRYANQFFSKTDEELIQLSKENK